MNATTQPVTAIVMAEKFVDWAISSQAAQEWVEGSTTSGFSPDRMKPPRARGDMPYTNKITGIYCIFHDGSASVYIGGSRNVAHRLVGHRSDLRRGKHVCKELQRLHDATGMASLRFELVEVCDASDLKRTEQAHMDAATFKLLNVMRASENTQSDQRAIAMRKVWADVGDAERAAYGARVSAGVKLRYAEDGEYLARNAANLARNRASEAFKAAHQSPEANRKRSAATREHWQDQAHAADRIVKIKEGMALVSNVPGTCGMCGAAFVGPKTQRWCSPQCRMAGFNAGAAKTVKSMPTPWKAPDIQKVCGHCGDGFVGRKRQTWCGPKCRMAAFKAARIAKAC